MNVNKRTNEWRNEKCQIVDDFNANERISI